MLKCASNRQKLGSMGHKTLWNGMEWSREQILLEARGRGEGASVDVQATVGKCNWQSEKVKERDQINSETGNQWLNIFHIYNFCFDQISSTLLKHSVCHVLAYDACFGDVFAFFHPLSFFHSFGSCGCVSVFFALFVHGNIINFDIVRNTVQRIEYEQQR